MISYYSGENNHHVQIAKINYINGVNDYLKINSWIKVISKRTTFVKPLAIKWPKQPIGTKDNSPMIPLVHDSEEPTLVTVKRTMFNPIFEESPIKVEN
jgi:hypothetical protein